MNTKENITLVENNNITSSEIEIAEKLNAFFSNIVKELNIKVKEDLLCDASDINDPVEKAIQKYKNHLSIQMIKEKFDSNKTFAFDPVSFDTIFKEILSVATHSNDVPTKIVKANTDLISIFVSNAFNESVISCKFQSVLKLADLNQSIRKNQGLKKLTIKQTVYYLTIQKRCMHRQNAEYFEAVSSRFQCGFRKGYSTQDCLLAMVENCKKALDQGNEYGALLTDLSKAFDCLSHDLIVAKLHAYCFLTESLKLINSYLTKRKQRVKMNDQFCSWLDIVVGVPQGSILGPSSFNIFLCDMLLFCNDIDFASYAYDNTPYCIGKTSEEAISQLEKSSKSIFEWFENNRLKSNPDKCHLLLSKNDSFEANINENRISNTRFEELLDVKFDNQLNFNHHISKTWQTSCTR